jgi:hypothetical protein
MMAKISALLLFIYATFYLDQLMHNIMKRSKIKKYILVVLVFIFNHGKKEKACPEEIMQYSLCKRLVFKLKILQPWRSAHFLENSTI